MTGILTEQKLISDCKYRVNESSSLVPVLFREVFSHPYISFFHLLVNGFSVIYKRTDPITLPCSLARAGNNANGLTLDEVLAGDVLEGDSGVALSDGCSSEGEGEGFSSYHRQPELDAEKVTALSGAELLVH